MLWMLLKMICGVMLRDMVESTMIASRVGVDDLEEHLRQKRLRWFGHTARRDEEGEIKKVFELKMEGRRKRGRQPLKNPCFHHLSFCPNINTMRIHALYTFHPQRRPLCTQYSTKPSKLHPCCLTLAATACSTPPVSFNISPKYANS